MVHNEGAACVPNIGPRERRKRLVFGFVFLAASGAALAGFRIAGVCWEYRLLLLLPLWVSAVGFFQAKEKT